MILWVYLVRRKRKAWQVKELGISKEERGLIGARRYHRLKSCSIQSEFCARSARTSHFAFPLRIREHAWSTTFVKIKDLRPSRKDYKIFSALSEFNQSANTRFLIMNVRPLTMATNTKISFKPIGGTSKLTTGTMFSNQCSGCINPKYQVKTSAMHMMGTPIHTNRLSKWGLSHRAALSCLCKVCW